MRLRSAVRGEGGCGSVGVGGFGSDSKAWGLSASGDVCTLRERDVNRGGGRMRGGDKYVVDSKVGVGGGSGVAGVTEIASAPDSGRQGRGRIEALRESCWCGTGGADLGVGGMGILGKGRIFWPASAN